MISVQDLKGQVERVDAKTTLLNLSVLTLSVFQTRPGGECKISYIKMFEKDEGLINVIIFNT